MFERIEGVHSPTVDTNLGEQKSDEVEAPCRTCGMINTPNPGPSSTSPSCNRARRATRVQADPHGPGARAIRPAQRMSVEKPVDGLNGTVARDVRGNQLRLHGIGYRPKQRNSLADEQRHAGHGELGKQTSGQECLNGAAAIHLDTICAGVGQCREQRGDVRMHRHCRASHVWARPRRQGSREDVNWRAAVVVMRRPTHGVIARAPHGQGTHGSKERVCCTFG